MIWSILEWDASWPLSLPCCSSDYPEDRHKPRCIYGKYTTRGRSQKKFAVDIPWAKGEGCIYCKSPMTDIEGSMIRYNIIICVDCICVLTHINFIYLYWPYEVIVTAHDCSRVVRVSWHWYLEKYCWLHIHYLTTKKTLGTKEDVTSHRGWKFMWTQDTGHVAQFAYRVTGLNSLVSFCDRLLPFFLLQFRLLKSKSVPFRLLNHKCFFFWH